MIRIKFFIIIFFLSPIIKGQNYTNQKLFVDYLIDNRLFFDADIEAKNIITNYKLDIKAKDSLMYLIGLVNLNLNRDTSIKYLSKVKLNIPNLHYKANIFLSDLEFKIDNIENAKSYILGLDTVAYKLSLKQEELKFIYDYSIKTLQGKLMDTIVNPFVFYPNCQVLLNKEQRRINEFKNRKPWKAGLFSAIIPGLGKVYAGQPRQGYSSFLIMGVMGYQAIEAYNIGGINDLRFITFSTLFSVFYIGNIWGSTLAVNIVKNEFYEETHRNLVATLRIPIRDL